METISQIFINLIFVVGLVVYFAGGLLMASRFLAWACQETIRDLGFLDDFVMYSWARRFRRK